MKKLFVSSTVLAGLAMLAGCSPSAGGGGGGGTAVTGTLPITASGRMLAFQATADTTLYDTAEPGVQNAYTQLTGTTMLDKSAPAGMAISGSAEEDPTPYASQGPNAALITATSADTMAGGTALKGITNGKGNVYFEAGAFGDPQVGTTDANLSAVGVYNIYENNQLVDTIVMQHGTTIRYADSGSGGNGNFGVGYIGNNTTTMPGSGTATYKGFWEGGVGAYDTGAGTAQMGLSGKVALAANFQTGKVSGGVTDARLETYDSGTQQLVNLNSSITGLKVDADITGSEYAGTATLVDSGGNAVGTTTSNNLIGAFLGDNAAETVAATAIEGSAELGGTTRNYILTGVIGGQKN
ncbi:hypothetical protein DFR52_11125 [Hoeflea marina]|uniref:Transferrin-binding protein B C-lobe/N-lobe beta-barrel domain-containing protein n=1 Tax=Hoeflea marina TaxID=274592 RepID=A0A317PBV8_9HYPH|nr:transferrin-binding protein-like solute binding protein [Hoeflea marina]PWV95394.1 hypothetical protein DFR52_11125 [Hoeflea marina]